MAQFAERNELKQQYFNKFHVCVFVGSMTFFGFGRPHKAFHFNISFYFILFNSLKQCKRGECK